MVKFDDLGSTPHGDGDLNAFLAFDFDSSAAYKSYVDSVEVSNPTPAALLRLKARFYKKTIDPALDIDAAIAAASGSTRAPPAKPKETPKPAAPPSKPRVEEPAEEGDGPRQRPAAAAPRAPPAPETPPTSRPASRGPMTRLDMVFLASHLVSVLALLVLWLPVRIRRARCPPTSTTQFSWEYCVHYHTYAYVYDSPIRVLVCVLVKTSHTPRNPLLPAHPISSSSHVSEPHPHLE